MENIEKNIQEWEEKFNRYIQIEEKCLLNIDSIAEIRNNLRNLLGNQKKDDILFYKSIIENSHFYLMSSLKIRKSKFLRDLNYIWKQIDERKQMEEVNKTNFTALLKDYKKMAEDIDLAKKNNTILKWVKDDKIENLQDLEEDLGEVMDYHNKLISAFSAYVEIEKNFYCNDSNQINIKNI